jgi:hypothetical protein
MIGIVLVLALVAVTMIRFEHVEEEGQSLWDVHLFCRYTITFIYDPSEGPVFWFSEQGRTLWRLPEYKPAPKRQRIDQYNA